MVYRFQISSKIRKSFQTGELYSSLLNQINSIYFSHIPLSFPVLQLLQIVLYFKSFWQINSLDLQQSFICCDCWKRNKTIGTAKPILTVLYTLTKSIKLIQIVRLSKGTYLKFKQSSKVWITHHILSLLFFQPDVIINAFLIINLRRSLGNLKTPGWNISLQLH